MYAEAAAADGGGDEFDAATWSATIASLRPHVANCAARYTLGAEPSEQPIMTRLSGCRPMRSRANRYTVSMSANRFASVGAPVDSPYPEKSYAIALTLNVGQKSFSSQLLTVERSC